MNDPAPLQIPEGPNREPESPELKADRGPRELGGPPGPEPTRYGDWEKAGRCIDF
ncbi:MAG TPA: DUF1674 domain-containing protein [Steroidobacteraceae bacterium]|nr:DUF1674 domain-containing protein [Steroidobacteraceae bacterium]